MSNLSAYVEGHFINWLTQGVDLSVPAPTSHYIALSTTDPLDDGTGITEPDIAMGYERQLITFDPPVITNGIGAVTTNSGSVVFPTATGDWGSIAFGAIFDSVTNGNMLIWFAWISTKLIETGDSFTVALSDISNCLR